MCKIPYITHWTARLFNRKPDLNCKPHANNWSPHFHRFLTLLESIENDTGEICMHCLRPIWKQHSTVYIGDATYHLACFINLLDEKPPAPAKKSDVFGRCRSCGGLTQFGVCVCCGFGVACCRCASVRYPDGSWRKSLLPTVISHTVCPHCIHELYPDLQIGGQK